MQDQEHERRRSERDYHRGMRNRHYAVERAVQSKTYRAEQNIKDLSGHAGYGNQLLPVSDLTNFRPVSKRASRREEGLIQIKPSRVVADQYWLVAGFEDARGEY